MLINFERKLLIEKVIATESCPVLLGLTSKDITDKGWLQKGMFLSFQAAFLNLVQTILRPCKAVV